MHPNIVNVHPHDCYARLHNHEKYNQQAAHHETKLSAVNLEEEVPFKVGQTWEVASSTPATTISSIAARNLKGISFFTNITLQFKFIIIMHSNPQTHNLTTTHSHALHQHDITIRLQRQIYITSEANQQHQIHAHYQLHLQSYLQKLQQATQILKNQALELKIPNFSQPHSKLKQLIAQSKEPKKAQRPTKDMKQPCVTADLQQNQAVVESRQLKEILGQTLKGRQQEQIRVLEQRLGDVYDKIGQELKSDCLYEKVLSKIKKQSHKAAKGRLLAALQKCIQDYGGWMQEREDSLRKEGVRKAVENKIVHNLEHMKNIMSKKIFNNDYIYQHLETNSPPNTIDNTQASLDSLILNRQEYQEQLNNLALNKNKKDITETSQKRTFDISKVERVLFGCWDVMGRIGEYEMGDFQSRECCLRLAVQSVMRRMHV